MKKWIIPLRATQTNLYDHLFLIWFRVDLISHAQKALESMANVLHNVNQIPKEGEEEENDKN